MVESKRWIIQEVNKDNQGYLYFSIKDLTGVHKNVNLSIMDTGETEEKLMAWIKSEMEQREKEWAKIEKEENEKRQRLILLGRMKNLMIK